MKLGYRSLIRFGFTIQIFKTALAAALSWWISTLFYPNPYPYFAPLAAILTVQITIADSLEKAMQRIVGIILGVLISLFIGHWISMGTLSIFFVVLVGTAIPSAFRLNNQITSQVAVSSLLVLAFGHNQGYAFGRIIETVIGCAVAIGINALLSPPNMIPKVETSLLNYSKRAANTLKSLTLLLEYKDSETDGFDEVGKLIYEMEKIHDAVQMAKNSLKYNLFLKKIRGRLDTLTNGMNQLEKVTVQIRGIRRGLADLIKLDGYERDIMNLELFCDALEATAACIEHYGEMMIYETNENKEKQRINTQRVESIILDCLNEMTQIKSPHVLREIGGILTDLNRILKEVSLDN
ncbi:FUSC family protein [Paenibacillus aestuarii]|uniref:Aromatic acid exporter family protein n=1 Tax=Paenibacillus aestuarii TaxID=516965 RepID=A0ABW0KDV8_9BACL|nr:FUSC family protein [Paenibacillus aestuarii]